MRETEFRRGFVRACRKLKIPVRIDGYGRYFPDTQQMFELFLAGSQALEYTADDMFLEFRHRATEFDAT